MQMQALAFSADVEGWHFHWQQSLDKALQAIELTGLVDNPLAEMMANHWARYAVEAMGGDEKVIRQHSDAALAAAERLHDRVWLPLVLGFGSLFHGSWGQWQTARELSDRGLALAPRNPSILASRILMEYQVGDFEQGEVYLERLMDVMRVAVPGSVAAVRIAWVIPEVARITGGSERFEVVEAAAEAVLSSPSVTPYMASFARVGPALIAIQRANATAASEQYAWLQVYRQPQPEFSTDRLLGLLAQTMGNLTQAISHFEEGLASCRKTGFRPELAWTCCDYADALSERDGESDHAKAITLLDESLAISSELGMRPLMERVLSRREILKA